jgi:hypothetical protein
MVYRKGELSKAMIDRQWPHQVALLAFRCGGGNYDRAHAEQFYERFGGEFLDPKDWPKWPGARR